ncbi:MAG TPA: NAD(P)/FAD-dependent oxidoreductase [Solirubrobacteraceae bacterium]|nr:NAD(P)/FAD-dependent oxidoreductase [Solirubrobacteraceae bacterium]
MTTRATTRGAERTSLDGTHVDVLICGASFAGLAVARELAGCGASVLVIDRYEIGERATSACAAPTPWLHAMGVAESISQEIPYMRFSTPHGSVRYRLPWSWSSFDYRKLCQLLFAQCDARFETAKVQGRVGAGASPSGAPGEAGLTREAPEVGAGAPVGVATDRGVLYAPLVVDALGWRRVLGSQGFQPPDAPLSRGLEVHPTVADPDPPPELDVWIERSLVRRGYGWRVPAGGEARVGVGSYAPTQHVREPTVGLAERLELDAVRFQGNWFPHRLRPAGEDGVFFVGDAAGHCFPLSGEGIRTAFYFGIACGRELRAVLDDGRDRADALARYHAFSARHGRAFKLALGLQRLIPALPPRVLTFVFAAIDRQWLVDRAFGWYLDQAHPAFAARAPAFARPAALVR